MKPHRPNNLLGYALAALAALLLCTGCETTVTSKGFSAGYNYHKPGRTNSSGPLPTSDQETLASAQVPESPSPEIQLPEPIQALGRGLGDLFDLITPPPPGASSTNKQSLSKGMIPNNFTGTQEIKDKNGNTILVHFDRGRIMKKEIIPDGSDKPVADAPKVFRSQQPHP